MRAAAASTAHRRISLTPAPSQPYGDNFRNASFIEPHVGVRHPFCPQIFWPLHRGSSAQKQLDVVESGDQRHADHQREPDLEAELLRLEAKRPAADGLVE